MAAGLPAAHAKPIKKRGSAGKEAPNEGPRRKAAWRRLDALRALGRSPLFDSRKASLYNLRRNEVKNAHYDVSAHW